MKKIIAVLLKRALTLACMVYLLSGCQLLAAMVEATVEIGKAVGEGAVEIAEAAKAQEAARKDQMPLFGLTRISKGTYNVNIDASQIRYTEERRKNALNLLAQTLGYESYDFKMLSEYSFKKKTYQPYWEYSITMPGSIPVVKNDLFTYRIDDNIEWTAITDAPFGKDVINEITYGNGMFVAVSYQNEYDKSGKFKGYRDSKMAYSPDGIIWTTVANTTSENKNNVTSINYSGGKFFLENKNTVTHIAYAGENFFAWRYKEKVYSLDGITWTAMNPSKRKDLNFTIGNIVYGNDKFVAVAEYEGAEMAYSSDGIDWTTVKSPFSRKEYIGGIAYGNGTFVIIGKYNKKIAYSTDGIKWNILKTSPFGKDEINGGITYIDGKFIAWNHNKVIYSTDGINWTAATSSIFWKSGNINNIVYGNGKYIAVGNGGGDLMAFSSDGIAWTGITGAAFNGYDINGIVYGDGKFVAVGNNGKISYWGDK